MRNISYLVPLYKNSAACYYSVMESAVVIKTTNNQSDSDCDFYVQPGDKTNVVNFLKRIQKSWSYFEAAYIIHDAPELSTHFSLCTDFAG